MTSQPPYALIFDMDGVLVDNTPYQAKAFQLLFREHGLTTNARQLLKRLNGMPATNILKTVFRHPVPDKQLKEYASQREFLYRVLYWDKRREMPGLSEFLQAARAAGFNIGLGTGSPPETISYIIDHLDLRQYFDVVTGKDDVEKGKPHADTFSVVAQKLGVPPERCVVFEDALLGEQAAYKAKMRCIGVSSGLKPEQFQAPLRVIRDFRDITPEQVRELLDQNPTVPKPSKELAKRQYMHL
ncbi:HAD family hydrolase [Hymenobacter cellulosivorans]|uniref:HAD-IA family hydrolase n=1 Tax=Hymenobacter cellulosivorans TaxID=2932249 RepID=A0ABY4FCS8_9BACT|nr:HAD-IA family hydrolase [Hymenobacter cellulosivorans]UOQ54475.1 HAD-IA family hydrolase [Hymenobacter cellulosivorans]